MVGLLVNVAPVGADPIPAPPQLPAPTVPATAPKLTIVSPAKDAVLVGRQTKAADDRYENLDCLQDAKKLGIKITAENWTVKPGGQGVLVVVDGVYATVVHDLSKPIMMASLEPYEHDTFANSSTWAVQYPMYTCGEHWIAAMPTTADGRMLRVAPVVSWWTNTSKDVEQQDEEPGRRRARLARGLPIVNWPLIGSLYIGRTWSQTETTYRSGRVVADPKHMVLDYTIAMGTPDPDGSSHGPCKLKLAAQDDDQEWNDEMEVAPTGTIVLPASYANNAIAIDADACGGMSPYFAKLWTKKPAAEGKPYTWPAPGSSQAEDYWHSAAGHAQFKQHVKAEQRRCDNGEGDCQYGHSPGHR